MSCPPKKRHPCEGRERLQTTWRNSRTKPQTVLLPQKTCSLGAVSFAQGGNPFASVVRRKERRDRQSRSLNRRREYPDAEKPYVRRSRCLRRPDASRAYRRAE